MQKTKNKLILLKEDNNLLKSYIKSYVNTSSVESITAKQLEKELKNGALLVNREDFPEDVICVNSKVIVEDKSSGKQFQFKLVLPAQANLRLRQISILAPMGIAMIGYRKGMSVSWQMPAGKKEFIIIDVCNNDI